MEKGIGKSPAREAASRQDTRPASTFNLRPGVHPETAMVLIPVTGLEFVAYSFVSERQLLAGHRNSADELCAWMGG